MPLTDEQKKRFEEFWGELEFVSNYKKDVREFLESELSLQRQQLKETVRKLDNPKFGGRFHDEYIVHGYGMAIKDVLKLLRKESKNEWIHYRSNHRSNW